VAVLNGESEAVRMLLAAGADVNVTDNFGSTVLIEAVQMDHPALALAIIAAGANLELPENRRALHEAAAAGQVDVIRVLLQRDIPPGARCSGRTAAMDAASNNRVEPLKVLRAAGADADLKDEGLGLTTLMHAAERGYVGCAKELPHAGANPDIQSEEGCTALHYAVRKGEKDAVEALLKAGASAGIKDREGRTARDEAAASGQADLAKRLQGKSGPR